MSLKIPRGPVWKGKSKELILMLPRWSKPILLTLILCGLRVVWGKLMENVERDGSPTVLPATTLTQPATPGEALWQEQMWWKTERNPERPGPSEGGSLGKNGGPGYIT